MKRRRQSRNSPRRRTARHNAVLPSILFLLAVCTFLPSLSNGFLGWDDGVYILSNPLLTGPTFQDRVSVLGPRYFSEFAPVLHLSYGVDFLIARQRFNPKVFRFSCVLFHALNTVLVWFLLLKLTDKKLVAFAAAVIFAIHPAQTETVCWMSQKKTLVATFLFLISFLAYLRWRHRLESADRRPAVRALVASLVAFAAALLTKQHIVVLPVLLVLYELLICKRNVQVRQSTVWLALAPFFALVIGGVFLGYSGQAGAGALGSVPGSYLPTMLPVLWRYIFLTIIPIGTNALHNPPGYNHLWEPVPLAAASAALAVIVIIILASRRNRLLLFWSAWFLVGLAPMLNIIPLRILMANRYLYVPIIAFCVLGGNVADIIWKSIGKSRPTSPQHLLTIFMAIATILFLGSMTIARQGVWRNNRTLWQDTLTRSPNTATAHSSLGEWYGGQGLHQKAEQEFKKTLEIDPQSTPALANLGIIALKQGRVQKAKELLEHAINNGTMPIYLATAHLNLGILYMDHYHNPQAALHHLRLSLEKNPYQPQRSRILEVVEKLRLQVGNAG